MVDATPETTLRSQLSEGAHCHSNITTCIFSSFKLFVKTRDLEHPFHLKTDGIAIQFEITGVFLSHILVSNAMTMNRATLFREIVLINPMPFPWSPYSFTDLTSPSVNRAGLTSTKSVVLCFTI